ncbi:hypothetical protein [Arthrobacter sp. RCC_34]|uniref:hypothetical protein n=1 Tax=Arthrobacter sp. RCC_34 TaxID=3239230 RepID=UPI0035246980
MRKLPASLLIAAVALSVTSCTSAEPTSVTTSQPAPVHTHDPADEDYPNQPTVTWDAASEKSVKDTATRAMTLFARPRVDQRTWITDLGPLLAPEYRTEAEYVNPARVPVSKILDGPVLVRESGNPMTVTATFKTNAGEYVVLLHRAGQAEPWLVQSIRPKNA